MRLKASFFFHQHTHTRARTHTHTSVSCRLLQQRCGWLTGSAMQASPWCKASAQGMFDFFSFQACWNKRIGAGQPTPGGRRLQGCSFTCSPTCTCICISLLKNQTKCPSPISVVIIIVPPFLPEIFLCNVAVSLRQSPFSAFVCVCVCVSMCVCVCVCLCLCVSVSVRLSHVCVCTPQGRYFNTRRAAKSQGIISPSPHCALLVGIC